VILLCFHGPSVFEPRSDCKSFMCITQRCEQISRCCESSPPPAFARPRRRLTLALAPQLALKAVKRREDEARKFAVFPKKETRNRHNFATRSGAHTSNYQRDTEERDYC
jgi:hypothetical protein